MNPTDTPTGLMLTRVRKLLALTRNYMALYKRSERRNVSFRRHRRERKWLRRLERYLERRMAR